VLLVLLFVLPKAEKVGLLAVFPNRLPLVLVFVFVLPNSPPPPVLVFVLPNKPVPEMELRLNLSSMKVNLLILDTRFTLQ
jgi:hypothetical protein